uniref:BPTI/Kunitz inhibitor domain-containing protein n=1 Tax=Parascaris univalens TaxID=6257 RepID=A0A915BUG9_PARUN
YHTHCSSYEQITLGVLQILEEMKEIQKRKNSNSTEEVNSRPRDKLEFQRISETRNQEQASRPTLCGHCLILYIYSRPDRHLFQ